MAPHPIHWKDVTRSSFDDAVDRALSLAATTHGLGAAERPAGWVRARVGRLLEQRAARAGIGPRELALRLESDPDTIAAVADALRVGETRFYRDAPVWEALEHYVLPRLPRARPLRALSAGCSTGEEAYTTAMLLASVSPSGFEVVGIDRSPEAIEAAHEGLYRRHAARELPDAWLARFCTTSGDSVRVGAALRAHVKLIAGDLLERVPPGPYHLVLFRNVLLHLSESAGAAVARRLASELHDGGFLVSAASEIVRLRASGLVATRVARGVIVFQRIAVP